MYVCVDHGIHNSTYSDQYNKSDHIYYYIDKSDTFKVSFKTTC